MDTGRDAERGGSRPVAGGDFCWRRFALWLPACLVLGVPVAWAAVVAQDYFAPFVIFPLVVGVGLGAIIVGLVRLCQMGNRPTVLLGTLLAVAVTVAGQHYVSYLTAYRWPWQQFTTQQHAGQNLSELAKGWSPSFAEFIRHQAARGRPPLTDHVAPAAVVGVTWGLWAFDGLLVLAAVLAMVIPAMRLPFCNCCRSWYRVTRSGKVGAQTAGRLAELVDVRPDGPLGSARYRLLNCNAGCGPTGFELHWQQPRGSMLSARAWLDTACRDRITRVLDEARGEDSR